MKEMGGPKQTLLRKLSTEGGSAVWKHGFLSLP